MLCSTSCIHDALDISALVLVLKRASESDVSSKSKNVMLGIWNVNGCPSVTSKVPMGFISMGELSTSIGEGVMVATDVPSGLIAGDEET